MVLHSRRSLMSGAMLWAVSTGFGLSPQTARAADSSVVPPPVPVLTRQHDIIAVNSVSIEQPLVALTFDDGPHPVHTPRLLDILKERGVIATFYLIGRSVRAFPDVARRIAAEGHEIGNHTWSHPELWGLGDYDVLREIDRTNEVIWRTVGLLPVTMRPPYGAITRYQSRMLHDTRLLPTVMWSVDPSDYRRPGPDVVASRIITKARSGAIVLAHDIHGPTVDAMPATIDGLRERGFSFASMSSLLGWGKWGKVQMAALDEPEWPDQDD
ncbi:MAG: polysaccharide deacetylase family protein [Phaeovulum sp.]|nr:polysaccharide deacetylase family protein [Phaeovulum sp.]MDP2064268.1 polysaccharide deacetylase family protein [Phaeovulum sp.]